MGLPSLSDFAKDPLGSVGEALGISGLSLGSTIDSIGEYIGEKILDYLAPDLDYQDRKIPARGPTNPRRVIYGQARVGGQIPFIEANGTDNEFLDVVYILASHPCHSIGDIYIGDTLSTDAKYDGLLSIYSNISGDGVLIPQLAANTTLDPARHKFIGLSYIYIRFKYNQEAFQGQPSVSVIVEGKNDIYDPRTLTSGYTKNGALCTRDWLVNYLNAQDLDDSWIEAADDCDTLVAAADGATEPRFELSGTITLSGSRIESLAKLTTNGGVIPRYEQGVWGAVIQKYNAPAVNAVFNEDDIIADIQVSTGSNKQDKINTVKGSFISAANNYEQIEYPALESDNYLAEDLEVLDQTVDYQMVASGTQCRRISKILLEKSRFGLTVSTTLRFKAWQYPVGSNIKLSYSRFGWDERVFRIVSRDIDGLNGISVVLREDSPEIYSWEEGDAIDVIVPPVVNLPDPDFVTTPFDLAGVETLYISNTSKSVKARLTLSWDSDDLSTNHYEVEGSYDGGAYRVFTDYVATKSYAMDDLELGNWIFRVRAVNGINAKSAYVSIPFTIQGKTAPPASVTGFTGNIRPFSIEIVWDAVPEVDVAEYEIRLGLDWDTAELLQRIDALKWEWETRPTGNENLLIKAIDTTSNYSTNASVATIEIQDPKLVEPLIAKVVDNNVELRWSDATTSFNIDRYDIRRGNVFDTATSLGSSKSTFKTTFEVVAGAFTYWVQGIDVQGNKGPAASVNANVDQPPDFVLQANQLLDLSSGTKVNFISEIGEGVTADSGVFTADTDSVTADVGDTIVLVGPADLVETWDEHFENIIAGGSFPNTYTADTDLITADSDLITADNGAPSIRQLQTDNGFPFYLQPTPTTASYETTVDFLGTFNLSRIQLIPSVATLAGNPSITYTVGYSADDITYVDSVGLEATGVNFRYVRIKLDVTNPDNLGLIRVNSLRLRLDVKLKTDAGRVTVDGTGTANVPFNIAFVDIQSIQVSTNSTSNDVVTYSFVDIPNPTDFDVNLFDNLGTAKAGEVSWNVRGV